MGVGGGKGGQNRRIITHRTPAETQKEPRGLLQIDRCIRTHDCALLMLLMLVLFFFFKPGKKLQLKASRLYFPPVNFKHLLPLPLKLPAL